MNLRKNIIYNSVGNNDTVNIKAVIENIKNLG